MAKQDTVVFTGETKQGTHRFLPGPVYQFKGDGVAEYFVRCGWAKFSTEDPAVVYEDGEVEVDYDTFHRESGKLVSELKLGKGD